MADFHQNGIITTLHNLTRRNVTDLEGDLKRFSNKTPLGLVLPCLYSELKTDALSNIVQELSKVDYLSQIIIGLDQADEQEFYHANRFFSELGTSPTILWNHGPRLQAFDKKLQEMGLAPREEGKGRNVWYCFGYALATDKAEAIALHDCDITTYDRGLLARLLYPVSHPQFNYEFCKGYYARISEGKINGRVSRLLVTPLLRALKRVLGPTPYLEFLDSFRYPLAGEFSFKIDVLKDLRIPSDWGLEIGVLSEMHRNYATNRLCQADIADNYDHKHQDLSLLDNERGLSKMSVDICKALFKKLATYGHVMNQETFRALRASYYRIALDFVETYNNDALMNGLQLDIHKEEQAVELFAKNLMVAADQYLNGASYRPFMPSWNRVLSAMPNAFDELVQAVEADREQFLASRQK